MIVVLMFCVVVNGIEDISEIKVIEFDEEGIFYASERGTYEYGDTILYLEEGIQVVHGRGLDDA